MKEEQTENGHEYEKLKKKEKALASFHAFVALPPDAFKIALSVSVIQRPTEAFGEGGEQADEKFVIIHAEE